MKTFSEEHKKKLSESAKRRCDAEWRKNRSQKLLTPLDTKLVKSLYENGMTQKEIAQSLQVSQKVIWRHMKIHGIPSRKAAKRNQFGEKNDSWKGNKAKYAGVHRRVKMAYGSPKKCEWCKTEAKQYYDWACVGNDYWNIKSYVRLCRPCHRNFDLNRINKPKKPEL